MPSQSQLKELLTESYRQEYDLFNLCAECLCALFPLRKGLVIQLLGEARDLYYESHSIPSLQEIADKVKTSMEGNNSDDYICDGCKDLTVRPQINKDTPEVSEEKPKRRSRKKKNV